MEEFDLMTIIIGSLALAKGALQLNPVAFQAVQLAEYGGIMALIVFLVASLSDVLGQSMTLLANRVSPGRFGISIIASVLALVVSVTFWTLSIWISANLFFGAFRPFTDVSRDVLLSHAPLIFGVFAFIPYLGNYIYRILRIWIFLALLVAIQTGYGFNLWQALIVCALGWIVYEAITRFPVIRPDRLSRWWWRVTTGTPEPVDIQARADELAEQGRLLLHKNIAKVSKGGN